MRHDNKHMYDLCKQHMHSYVLAETHDGSKLDGIVTGLDDEYVYMAVPIEPHEIQGNMASNQRHFDRQYGYGPPGYGYPGYGGYGGYGGGYGPGNRFKRLILPLAALTAISILPWY
ncbi:MAG TPA: hypothetical protein VK105_20965 [Virgibacillus sp.]|nr:hypothetical protein [Virgibacillus sp.]HLR69566.1 hypothetical protein [Virgibacillus sp.]